jgi:DNA-binding IclR family transcriptional regulator
MNGRSRPSPRRLDRRARRSLGSGTVSQPSGLRTVDQAVAILHAYARRGNAAGVRELARELDMSKSTFQRIAVSLERARLLAFDPEARRYSLGSGVLELAAAYERSYDFYGIARAQLERVAEATGETVCLAMLIGDARVNVVQVESRQALRFSGQVRRSFSLVRGASSRSLVAQLDAGERAALLDRLQLGAMEREALDRSLDDTGARGHAVSRGEITDGGTAISVPVGNRRPPVAISLYAPDARMPEARLAPTVETLAAAAAELARVLPEVAPVVDHERGGTDELE